MNLTDYGQLSNPSFSLLQDGPQPLVPGTSREVVIYPHHYWNRTGLLLESQGQYVLEVQGDQFWVDAHIFCGPYGFSWVDRFWPLEQWSARLFKPWCRHPEHNWFALMGALDADERTAFAVGRYLEYRPERDGELCCYANDVPGCYANNWGPLKLTVTRL